MKTIKSIGDPMNQALSFVSNETQVIKNIKQFNKEMKKHASNNTVASIENLVNTLSTYRAWYCFYDNNTNSYQFAPSKYIGYKGMNARIYHTLHRSGMDGRQTESVLANWYEQISKNHPLYDELSEKLRFFCSKFGKKPNSLFRINIVIDTNNVDSLEDNIVELIWKIFLGLSKSNKQLLKTKIDRIKL
jgi:hypothetical protein